MLENKKAGEKYLSFFRRWEKKCFFRHQDQLRDFFFAPWKKEYFFFPSSGKKKIRHFHSLTRFWAEFAWEQCRDREKKIRTFCLEPPRKKIVPAGELLINNFGNFIWAVLKTEQGLFSPPMHEIFSIFFCCKFLRNLWISICYHDEYIFMLFDDYFSNSCFYFWSCLSRCGFKSKFYDFCCCLMWKYMVPYTFNVYDFHKISSVTTNQLFFSYCHNFLLFQ